MKAAIVSSHAVVLGGTLRGKIDFGTGVLDNQGGHAVFVASFAP